jgi:hypothetical protein
VKLLLPECDRVREARDLFGQQVGAESTGLVEYGEIHSAQAADGCVSVLAGCFRVMEELRYLHKDRVFSRREALDHGYSDDELQVWLRGGVIARIRHGAYTFTDVWANADEVERHRLRAHAVLRSHGTRIALSHTSAAVEHGLRLYDSDLRRIHVTCLDRPIARTTKDVVYHQGTCSDDDLVQVGSQLVVAPVRAGLEAASLTHRPGGLVILDSVIDLALGTLDEIHLAYERMAGWPNSRKLQITVRLTRQGANSAGESLGRHLMWTQHLPEPQLQFEVRDQWGRLLGVTDFAWPEYGLLGEFDGMIKYGRLLKDGETPGDAVVREKKREDALREETGWLMVRLIWAELFQPGATGAKIRRQLERGRALVVA